MRSLCFFLAAFLLAVSGPATAQVQPGKLTGGIKYSLPDWFKPSLLDLREEVEGARARKRHVLLFLHLEECPYCARMLDESFRRGENHDFMRKHFDVIGINVRGAQEVQWTDGKAYTEQALARRLKAFGTPVLVFLAEDGGVALQLAGYREPRALRLALEFVQGGHHRSGTLAAWLATREKPAVYVLRDHPQFAKGTEFRGYRKPLAFLLEDRQCAECARLHDRTLRHPDVLAEMKKFRFVRLDTDSAERLVTPEGTATTVAQWAKALGLTNRPAIVLYDEGREIFRFDGHLYHFHFKEALRYVSGGHYKRFAGLSQYNAARRAELSRQGVDIDYSQ